MSESKLIEISEKIKSLENDREELIKLIEDKKKGNIIYVVLYFNGEKTTSAAVFNTLEKANEYIQKQVLTDKYCYYFTDCYYENSDIDATF